MRVETGVEVMNPSPSHCTHIENTSSRWGWLVNIGRLLARPTVPPTLNATDFSSHMLRDMGMLDGRPLRGEAPASHDDLQKDIFKGSV
jgi:hypothetical protein